MSQAVAVSVVLCTYNRADLLRGAMTSILQQPDDPPFELIVVDNNSRDNTAEIVHSLAASDARVRYVFEPKQGLSHARQAGIAASLGPIVAFTDDDVRVTPQWVRNIQRCFDEHPEAGYAGGKVLPLWPSDPPAWLTNEHWAPLALVDYGDATAEVSGANPKCLVGANLSFRRETLVKLGSFSLDLQRVEDSVGSMEDYDIQERWWKLGGVGVYDPAIEIHADIQSNRLLKPYHRRWHQGHGHFHAIGSGDRYYPSNRKYFGVPSAMYRRVARLIVDWAKYRAFASETELWFISGFMRQRIRKHFTRA